MSDGDRRQRQRVKEETELDSPIEFIALQIIAIVIKHLVSKAHHKDLRL